MKQGFLFLGILICLFACKQDINNMLSAETCSSIKEIEGKKVVSNFYFEKIDSQRVFAVHEIMPLQEKNALPHYEFTQVYPENNTTHFSFDANAFEVKKNYLKTESYSLPGEIAFQLINTNNGNTLLNYTYDLYEASFLNESEIRYVGFYANTACNKALSGLKFDKNTLGFLSLATNKNKLYTLKINCEDAALFENIDAGSPEISLKSTQDILDLDNGKTIYFTSDATKLEFSANLNFYTKDVSKNFWMEFDIVDDKFVLNKNSNPIFSVSPY
ncbi:MAG: hypothetical protein LRY27_00430 [Chitinophagales bacterium]|nr:hypothetical protein [Chitinophagales bacterium]